MSDIMTNISLNGVSNGHMIALWGRKTRAEIIQELRTKAQHDLDAAKTILAAHDDQFSVKIVLGSRVQHLVEELMP